MNRLIVILSFLCISTWSFGQKCALSTARVNSLVKNNWRSIQKKASFTVSAKKNFDIRSYQRDGNDLEVNVISRGFFYDIKFTVSFDDWFDDNCYLNGEVIGIYNYKKL